MPSTHAARHRPVHPGEILREEFLVPLGISMYRLAKDTCMPADRVGRLVHGTRAFSADTALPAGDTARSLVTGRSRQRCSK